VRILFLADPEPDYVADGLFHGLRTLLGADVVDFPKREAMYAGVDLSGFYARGFGLYGLLEDIEVDRDAVFERDWDLVVSAVMWRDWVYWERAWKAFGGGVRHAVVDGGDLLWAYPYGPPWWRPSRWFVPRAHRRARFFKREADLLTTVLAARRLPLLPIGIAYPAEKMCSEVPLKTQEFPRQIVDLEVGERLGRRLEHDRQHLFQRESDYLEDLRASRFGITTKRAGWDALRHVEIAAAGAVPCFRDLERKPARCAPHGLIDAENCLSYRDAEDLMRRLKTVGDDDVRHLAESALIWAAANSTVARATRFMECAA
jgi:hypothetical protein